MAKRGRKSYYDTRIEPRLEEIKGWCRDGYTDKLMGEALGVSHETFCKYKREKPEFIEALKVNKAIADITVENSLYKRANGYRYNEVTQKAYNIKDKDGKITGTEMRVVKSVTKEVLPDVVAQIFWLKNRTDNWTDRRTNKDVNKEPIILNLNFGGTDGD